MKTRQLKTLSFEMVNESVENGNFFQAIKDLIASDSLKKLNKTIRSIFSFSKNEEINDLLLVLLESQQDGGIIYENNLFKVEDFNDIFASYITYFQLKKENV